jgi:hypothetical protein
VVPRSGEAQPVNVWRDPKSHGSPPNNWRAVFGGPAWTFDEESGQYYLHNFVPEQPDLDWWNDGVRAAFDEIMRLVDAPKSVWAFRSEGGAFMALNLCDEDATLEEVHGAILIASDRARDEEIVDGVLELGPLEAAIVATAEPS